MVQNFFSALKKGIGNFVLSVPVRWKIVGIGILPVIILGFSLNYWITTGLSDWLSYILTDVRVEAAMQAGSRSMVFVTLIAAFFSIILLMLMVYILNTPLEELKKTAEAVASGQFDSRAEVWADDEIGSLAISINQMIDNFVEIQQDLSLTNRQLEAINRIALAADQNIPIHDILYIMLDSLLNLLDFDMGWVYLYDPELQKFHLASWKGVPEELGRLLLDQERSGDCECRRGLVEKSLREDVELLSCSCLEDCGCVGENTNHITIPIKAGQGWFGLINLHQPEKNPLDPETVDLLASIGKQISESVANAWLQIKLREKEIARQLLLESVVTAQEDERSRLARELHDQAGQSLTNLLVLIKTIENKSSESEVKADLAEALELTAKSIDEIRDLSYSLRPPALEEFGLVTAISSLADDMTQQIDVQIICNCEVECSLPKEIEVVLYRIAQEGITNIVRHAEANSVTIELDCQPQMFHLKIEDDGRGFDPAQVSVKMGSVIWV